MTEQPRPGLWSRLRALPIAPVLEIAVLVVVIAVGTASYFIFTGRTAVDDLLSPPEVAALLVANLVPAMALMVLLARRVAKRRAAQAGLGGNARLHVRLVALFSVIASVPTLLVVIFASFMFQSGMQFWYSDQVRSMLENAQSLGNETYQEEMRRVDRETVTMASDLATALGEANYDSPEFQQFFGQQLAYRNLSEAILMRYTPDRGVQTMILVNPYDRQLEQSVQPQVFQQLQGGLQSVILPTQQGIGSVARFPVGENLYLYASRVFEPRLATSMSRSAAVLNDYRALTEGSRNLQLRFNAALLVVSLLIVGIAIWVALTVADRMVRPVSQLVDAAKRISGGDLSARVPEARVRDEIGTLGEAFNVMTGRLEAQTGALVSANEQLESRGAFMEAVLAGVTAGVISVDGNRVVGLANSTAESLLETSGLPPVGRTLAEVAPELDRLLTDEQHEAVVQFATRGEPRTLAVKIVAVDGGHVMTFDDITEQLIDQRRAAWSDVARRIAHEIKNPLTPIQLAAERLQRKYGQEISSDTATFERLTGTIVRQVGDLRRMVDEFSSFARMPKPVFEEAAVVEIARQAMFLHEVAHPDIRFTMDVGDAVPPLVCDRRLVGQALTNIVKNGVEAIQQKWEDSGEHGEGDAIRLTVRATDHQLLIEVADTGIGLPQDRRRITEPYMTTRAKGTGLGLAIVKKIVEEHFGTIDFADREGGGTKVTLSFDTDLLARIAAGHVRTPEDTEVQI